MGNIIAHAQNKTANTSRKASPAIWSSCPEDDLRQNRSLVLGTIFEDDFDKMPLPPTLTTQIAYSTYKAFATSGNTLAPVSAINSVDVGGGIAAFTHGSSGESVSLAQAPAYKITGLSTTSGKLWFECRIAVKSVLTLRNAFFVGLAETNLFTLASGVPFATNAGNPTADGAMLGFHRLGAGTSIIDPCYNDRATSLTNVNVTAGEVTGCTAFTFVKLGLIYDPADSVRTIRFFADNVELASAIAAATITATTNLKANSLGLMAVSMAGASVSTDFLYMDWWKIAQLYP